MGDTLMTVVAIFLAVILMFLFPMLSVSERTDDISQLSATTAVTSFVDDSRSIGRITMAGYDELMGALNATGNSYDIEMEVKVLDENIGKKSAWTEGTVVGENVYYSVYTSQIMEELQSDKGYYQLKEGDILTCKAKNNNTTISQTLRSVFYSTSSSTASQVEASHTGIVTSGRAE